MKEIKLTKQQFIQQYQKTLIQEQAASIDLQTTMQHIKLPILLQIKHYVVEGDLLAQKERQMEFMRVQKHLKQLQQQVNMLQQYIGQNDIEQLKPQLLLTQTNILQARGGWQQANKALEDRCDILEKEISQGKQRLIEIQKLQFTNSFHSSQLVSSQINQIQQQNKQKTTNSNLYNRNQPQQLKLIDEELRRIGAPYGGWSQSDHDKFWIAFLQNKQQNRRKFLEQIAIEFPTFTMNALARHDEFCLKTQELNQKKKEYIQKMKEFKQQEKHELNLKNMQDSQNFKLQQKETKQVSAQDKEKIRALRERRAMVQQDQYSQQLRQLSIKQIQERQIRENAKLLKNKIAQQQQEKLKQKYQKKEELEQQTKMDPIKQLQQQKLQQKLKEQQMQRIKQTKQQYQKLVERKNREETIQQKLDQLADQFKPNIERDDNNLYKRTKMQENRLQEIQDAKQNGRKLGGSVTVGFDPFAVVPIGGFARPSWM